MEIYILRSKIKKFLREQLGARTIINLIIILTFLPFYCGFNLFFNKYFDTSSLLNNEYVIGNRMSSIQGVLNDENIKYGNSYVDIQKQLFVEESGMVTIDPRILAMYQFLSDHGSPLAPYASTFIREADKYGLDWRLVASISGIESGRTNS